ncbi:helix-turn-helix transcriptional regulator [Sphingopyxis sp.]|jgi:transcriptional regulator with XRE-family HTH domain|uniref:helix-turn-helix domain-containing protein n=1 Tax=Sphingopyxis sp. TaxID=1908224 RepID=UPI00311F8D18
MLVFACLFDVDVRKIHKLKVANQEKLAARSMERSYIGDLERGTRNPSVAVLGRIADAPGIEPHTLLITS